MNSQKYLTQSEVMRCDAIVEFSPFQSTFDIDKMSAQHVLYDTMQICSTEFCTLNIWANVQNYVSLAITKTHTLLLLRVLLFFETICAHSVVFILIFIELKQHALTHTHNQNEVTKKNNGHKCFKCVKFQQRFKIPKSHFFYDFIDRAKKKHHKLSRKSLNADFFFVFVQKITATAAVVIFIRCAKKSNNKKNL